METLIETPIYTPKNSYTLDKAEAYTQIRLILQGVAKSGKTYAALTFPYPTVLSLDRGLISHTGRADVIEIPFFNGKFVDSIKKRDGISQPPNKKEAILIWLTTEGLRLTKEQTLIVDHNTALQAAYHIWYRQNPDYSAKKGEENTFSQYRWKIDYFTEIMDAIKALTCNVVYLCHEYEVENEIGAQTGQQRPLMSGQFVNELQSHFTDSYRALTIPKPSPEKVEDFKKKFELDNIRYQEWMKSGTDKMVFIWQTLPDEKCKGLGTSLIGAPKYILANYSEILKYKTKQI